MKYIVSVYMWVFGLLLFSIMVLFSLIGVYIFPIKTFEPTLKASFRLLFKLLFMKVEVVGSENIESGKTYLFMSNHVSVFDAPLTAGFIPRNFRAIEADSHFKWFGYGALIKRMGNIPINRNNVRESLKSINKAVEYLKNGRSMLIFPEGHRSLDGEMRPFKKLPFHMAKEAGVDIIPFGISGLFRVKAKNNWLVQPTRIQVKYGKPISAETIKKLSKDELMEHTREKIAELVEWQ